MSIEEDIERGLEAAIADGDILRVGNNTYTLTERGKVRAAHMVRTNPDAARFYLALLCKDLHLDSVRETICRLGKRYMARVEGPNAILPQGWQDRLVEKARNNVRIAELVADVLLAMAADDAVALEMGAELMKD